MGETTYVGPRAGCGFLHRHECDGATCDGSKDVPNDGDPFTDEDTDDTRREDEPGDWFVADFDGECSRNVLCYVFPGDTIRADGDGGWECRKCVDEDSLLNVHGEDPYAVGGAA